MDAHKLCRTILRDHGDRFIDAIKLSTDWKQEIGIVIYRNPKTGAISLTKTETPPKAGFPHKGGALTPEGYLWSIGDPFNVDLWELDPETEVKHGVRKIGTFHTHPQISSGVFPFTDNVPRLSGTP